MAPLPVAVGQGPATCSPARLQRWHEIENSVAFVTWSLEAISNGATRAAGKPLTPNAVAVSVVEGWRGEIVHAAVTDETARFASYKIVDPSFRNWFGLAFAMRGQAILDFPLCNKSFNLSYCGHDL